MRKKISAVFLLLFICILLCSCGNKAASDNTQYNLNDAITVASGAVSADDLVNLLYAKFGTKDESSGYEYIFALDEEYTVIEENQYYIGQWRYRIVDENGDERTVLVDNIAVSVDGESMYSLSMMNGEWSLVTTSKISLK